MQNIIKNPIIIFLLLAIVLIFAGGLYLSIQNGQNFYKAYNTNSETQKNLKDLQEKLTMLQEAKKNKPVTEKKTDKTIYKTAEPGIGSEASFAPLFDMFLNIAKSSGIRIRSISYNYNPLTDPIIVAKLTNYNVCELDIKAVGSYRNFQTFFKSVAKEPYLMSLAQTEIQPWENDRKVLVGNLKINLYTKTN